MYVVEVLFENHIFMKKFPQATTRRRSGDRRRDEEVDEDVDRWRDEDVERRRDELLMRLDEAWNDELTGGNDE